MNLSQLYKITKAHCGGGVWAYLLARYRLCLLRGVSNDIVNVMLEGE